MGNERIYRFEYIARDQESGIYYPTKMIAIQKTDEKLKYEDTYELLEVEHGEDYDDEVFQPSLKEGTHISDFRVEPAREFTYSSPEQLEVKAEEIEGKSNES